MRNLQVVADKDNNDILIVATPVEYQIIEAALRKLDVQSRQVVMELAIIEVALNDDLEFGVDWLFRGGAPSGRGSGGNINTTAPVSTSTGNGITGSGTTNGISASLLQGFSYLISNVSIPRRHPGGRQAAGHLWEHQGGVQPAHLCTGQPEGHDQGGHDRTDQRAVHCRQHHERGHHDVVLYRAPACWCR